MLSKHGTKNLTLLKELINQFWGTNVRIINEEVINAPFDMFKMNIIIYDKFEILIEYDRSIIGISIKIDNNFINLRKLTDKETIKGFESSEKDSILYNFKILDDVLKSIN